MKKGRKVHPILKAVQHYVVFFFVVAFVITCCMLLFISTFSKTMDVDLTRDNLSTAAKATFFNVLILSLLFTAFDSIRRHLTVDRPVMEIKAVLRRLKNGEFDARASTNFPIDGHNHFHEIASDINALASELSGVETLRTDFIANVSHELKTPLAVMQNYGTMLQQPDLPEDKRLEYAKSITEASRRLADLITNILKLNKLENQQIYPQAAEYNLSEQLCESLLQFESVWEKKNIDIEADIEEDIYVCADGELLSLVWNNLLSNAFKFTEPGGKVSLSLTADSHLAAVKVTDTGCGMSAEVGAHIFEKFYQGDNSHATHGNGLGLALVKRVVDITHGEISVESSLGKGSTFTVKIQRANDGEVKNNWT